VAAAQGLQPMPPPQVMPNGPAVRTFTQLYSDEARDPCRRQYDRIMQRFDANQPGAPASDVLYEQVVTTGGDVPQAYLFCAETVQGPLILCAHFPCKYKSALDGSLSRWDDLSFAFVGELVQGMVTTMIFPRDAFDIVTVHTRTTEYFLQHLDDLRPILPVILPNAADATIEEVRTRKFAYLPAAYVPLFLNTNGYTPTQVWDLLIPALTQRQELMTCQPLLTWLRAASVGTAVALPNHVGPPTITANYIAPTADENLLLQRNKTLSQALPQLNAPAQSLETALSNMATALINQTNDQRHVREQKAMLEASPKLPSDRFNVTLPVLLDLLQIANEDDLPVLWHRWANCTKKQEVQVLRDSLDAYAISAEAFSPGVPIITLRLVQDLLSFNFLGQSADDIKSGLHPFIITDGNAESRQANAEIARIYGLINATEATFSLADLDLLTTKEVRSVPLTYWEMEKSLGMFGNLLGVVLGSAHPLTISMRELWQLLQTNVRDDLHAALDYKGFVKPTHILRSVQLICYTWFSHRRAHLTPPTPDMKTIIHQILMQIYVMPHLPPQLYQLSYPKKSTPSIPNSTGSTASLTTSDASRSTNIGSSDGSVVSGITLPTLKPPPPTPTRGSAVINLTPNPTLQALIPSNIKLKELIGSTAPPQFDAGGEMCLSFLTRNTCWSNCRRASSHRSNLTDAEQNRLRQYIETQKQLHQARRTAASTVPP
jgi:hypothetical protein